MAYYAAHRDEARAYYAVHREERLAHNVSYAASHRGEKRTYRVAYNASHREARHAYHAAWYAAHRKEKQAYSAAYHAAHPEKQREHDHRRRARLRAAFIEPVNAAAIYARDRGRCHICGKKVMKGQASLDHLAPLSKGGAHAPWNVGLAHLTCNLRRGNRGPAQARLALL